jgi:flavodoxin
MNPFFNPIYEAITKTDCNGKAAFFIGCGDFRYEPILFNMGIQKIHDAWIKQNGKVMHHPLKINGDPQLAMEKVVYPWIEESFSDLELLAREQPETQQ